MISCHVTTLHGTNHKAGLWRHLLSCWTPSKQTAKKFLNTTRSWTPLTSHTNWEKSNRDLRIQMVWKFQFFRTLDVSLDCLEWIEDHYVIWKQLLLVAVNSRQKSIQKRSWKTEKQIKIKVSCLFGFHL